MIRKVSKLYEDYVERPGCGADLRRIAMWTFVIIIIAITIFGLGK